MARAGPTKEGYNSVYAEFREVLLEGGVAPDGHKHSGLIACRAARVYICLHGS